MSHNKSAVVGMVLLAAIVILCILSPYICPWPYSKMNMPHAYQGPNLTHLLGTDHIGRDLLSRVLYGARYTLVIGITATVISAVLGILMGAVAGYFGGFIDSCLMRFPDIFQAFPTLILAMAFCAIFGKGVDKCIWALGITGIPGIPGFARRIEGGSHMSENKNAEKLFSVRHLVVEYHSGQSTIHAVNGVSFELGVGETVGLVGESGCGKSTLGRTLIHLNESTGGQILYRGQDVTRLNRKQLADYRRDVQMIFQDPFSSLDPRQTVQDIIEEPMRLTGKLSKGELFARPLHPYTKALLSAIPTTDIHNQKKRILLKGEINREA